MLRASFVRRALAGALVAALFAASDLPARASRRDASGKTITEPTPPPASRTVYGDLSHLTYTATGDLHATFVSPSAQSASPVDAVEVTAATVRGAGIELRANGAIVDSKHLGKRTVNEKTGRTEYFFYGVPLVAGPNTLQITALGAGGLRGDSATQVVYGPDEPASASAVLEGALIADGVSSTVLRVQVLDRFGHAAIPGTKLRITIARGDAHFSDRGVLLPDPLSTGPQAGDPHADVTSSPDRGNRAQVASGLVYEGPLPVGGLQDLHVVPGTVAGPLRIDILAGGITTSLGLYIAPNARAPFVSGLISIGAGSMPVAVDGDGIYDGGGARRGRIAIFGNGRIGASSVLTFAYESQNRLSPVSSFGPFIQDPNERPYLTYGDSSVAGDTLHSADHFYARLERGRSSLMWGQFNVAAGGDTIGAYHQLLSGAKADLTLGRDGRVRLLGFTARNDQAFASLVLPISGLAALAQPLEPNIVVGSDILQLIVLDRHTGIVISQTPLIRNVDYTIDYATGVLRFINVPLPFDANFNPQAISIQYEYQGPGVLSQTTGAGVELTLGRDKGTKLKTGYVNDASGTANFSLVSQSFTRTWNGGSWEIEHASNRGVVPGVVQAVTGLPGGDAISFVMHEQHESNRYDAAFQKTTAGFADPFGGLSSPGLLAYRFAWTRSKDRTHSFSLSFDGQANRGVGQASAQTDASATYNVAIGKAYALLFGLTQHKQNAAAPAPLPSSTPGAIPLANLTQTQAEVGITYTPNKRLEMDAARTQTLSGSDVGSSQPSGTTAQVSYRFSKVGRAYLRELWSAQPAATFANATSGLALGASSTHIMQFGIENDLSPTTTVDSQYIVSGVGSAANIYSALGVNQKVHLGKYLGGAVSAQLAHAIGGTASGFNVYTASLAYARENGIHAALAYQDRTGAGGGSTIGMGITGKLSSEVSVLGRISRAYGNGSNAIDDRISMAYRPTQNDRFTSLFGYQRTNDGSSTPGSASVVSFEELYRPIETLEFASRVAYKLDNGGAYAARTTYLSLRARKSIGRRFDIGAAVRTIAIPQAAQARATDFAVEAGYAVGSSSRVAVGYNFSGSVDPTLTGHPDRKGVYVMLTSLVDRVFGWGKP